MGQQQLMVIVMATVVSMASVAMGMQAFQEGQRKANLDAMMDDAIIISGDIQAWRIHPEPLGGGMGTDLDGFSLTSTGYETGESDEYITSNGTFTAWSDGNTIVVQGDNAEYDGRVMVTLNGQGSYCMRTKITDTGNDEPAEASDHGTCSGI